MDGHELFIFLFWQRIKQVLCQHRHGMTALRLFLHQVAEQNFDSADEWSPEIGPVENTHAYRFSNVRLTKAGIELRSRPRANE